MNRNLYIALSAAALAVVGVGAFFYVRRHNVGKLSDVLASVMPNASSDDLNDFAPAILDAMKKYEINTPARQAAFLAQCAEESNELWHLRDHYGTPRGEEYADGSAYEDRADLGNTEDGDGVRFKGRGLLQITGRVNYQAMSNALGVDLVSDPTQLNEPKWSALAAGEYWTGLNPRQLDCNALADAGNFTTITKVINGGTNGLAARQAYLAVAQDALGDTRGA